MTNSNISTLIAGLLFLGLGILFLAVNVYGFYVDWWKGVELILPALFIWAGVLKLWRHFTWPLEKLKERPGKAGLLSGLFWLSLGLVIALAVFDTLEFLPTVGVYWPVILLVFGLGKIIDFFRMKEIAGSSFGEVAGVVFIILLGLTCVKLHQLNVLILEQDPFWERIPEFIGIEELIEPTYERSLAQEIDLTDVNVLVVKNSYGDVSVEGSSVAVDKISGELVAAMREKDESRANEIFDQVRLDTSLEDGTLIVTTNRRVLKSQGRRLTTDLILKVPDTLGLEVKNEYGDIIVDGIKKDCLLSSRKGDVMASSINGRVQVKTDSEAVELTEIFGDVEIESRFAEVEVNGVTGNVSVLTSRRPVEVARVDGDVKIVNRHDEVVVSDITGAVEVKNPGGKVVLSGILGELNVENSKGDARISDTSGKVTLVSAYGEVTLEDLVGEGDVTVRHCDVTGANFASDLTIRGDNSGVNLESIKGGLVIETSQEPVFVSNVTGTVNIQNDLGKIHLRMIENPQAEIRIESRQGDITLELPGTAEFALDSRVTNGKIVSEFGNAPEQDARGDSVFETLIGENGPKVNLSTSGSVIEIRRTQ